MWPSANDPTWLNWHVAATVFFSLLMLPIASFLVAENSSAGGSDLLMHYAFPIIYTFMVTANVVPFVLWNRHVRFCENGILADRKVLLWSELLKHHFKDAYRPKLELKSANDANRPWLVFAVERDQVPIVENLFAEKTRNVPKLPAEVPVSLSQVPLSSVFKYPHLRKHLLCVSFSVAFGAWLMYLGWAETPANREFQDSLIFAIYAWSLSQGLRFRWFVGDSGMPIARIFARRDPLGFVANLGLALALYYATANIVWPIWWIGYATGSAFVFLVINTSSYYFLTQFDLRSERAVIPGALSWSWPDVKLRRWDKSRGSLVLSRHWRWVTAVVPPDQTEAIDRLLREKLLLVETGHTNAAECRATTYE